MSEKKIQKRYPSGEPGIYSYDTEDGRRWGVLIERDRDWRTGRRSPQRKHGFRTKKEARDWRIAELDKRRRGDTLEPSMLPFGQWCEEWLLGQTMRPKSIITLRNRLNHVTAQIGDVPLSRVTTAMLDRIYVELRASLSDNYVREIAGTTKTVLQRATDHRMIPHNPATLARSPAKTHTEHVTWTEEQMQAFLAVDDDPFWNLVFRFMAETWVRIGEMIDLRWDAVDCDAATVRIERTITLDQHGQRVSGTPKTKAGRRTIEISRELADWLRRHKDQQRFRGRGSDLVFPAPRTGTWMQQPSVAFALTRRCRLAGVPTVTPHGLRHIGTSLAYASPDNIPLKIISERLGHANATITQNIYAHVDQQQHRRAADQIAGMLTAGNKNATSEGEQNQK